MTTDTRRVVDIQRARLKRLARRLPLVWVPELHKWLRVLSVFAGHL